MERWRAYVQLMRLYGIFMAMMPLLGALSNGIFNNLLWLLIVGISANIFGFVQNDYFDIEIDKKSGYVADRPLASGAISKGEAVTLMALLFVVSVSITLAFFSYLSLLFLLLYYFFYTIYNRFSKKFAWMEYALGMAGTMIFLSGATSLKEEIGTSTMFIAFLPLLKYAFNVGVSANLKDLKYDSMQGIVTTPSIFRAYADDMIHIPVSFIRYGYALKLLFSLIALTALYFYPMYISPFLVLASIAAMLYTMTKIFENVNNRSSLLFYAEIHEILTYMVIASIPYDYIAIHSHVLLAFAVLVLPPLWILAVIKIMLGGKPLE